MRFLADVSFSFFSNSYAAPLPPPTLVRKYIVELYVRQLWAVCEGLTQARRSYTP